MNEIPRIEQWLYDRLSGDAALNNAVGGRIYAYLIPPEAALPAIVFSYQRGSDVSTQNGRRVLLDAVYLVKVVGEGWSSAPLQTIVDRIDAVLGMASGVGADGVRIECRRLNPIAYVEYSDGRLYRHLGGLWRIIATDGG